MTRTNAFTLVEILIASALMMGIIVLMGSIWQNAYRAADRIQAVMRAHQRARILIDGLDDLVVQRSGTMPLIAQNEGYAKSFPWQLGAWQSRSLLDPTRSDSGNLEITENNTKYYYYWADAKKTAVATDTWNDALTGDRWAPGRQLTSLVVGKYAFQPAQVPTLIWHSAIMRYDARRRYLGEDSAPPDPAWTYDSWSGADGDDNPGFGGNFATYENGFTDPNTVATRYQGGLTTALTTDGDNPGWLVGPSRNLTLSPWVHKTAGGSERLTTWLGRSHIYRSINGPSYLDELGNDGKPSRMTIATHGKATVTGGFLEPDWGFAGGAWNPDVADPALGTPRPAYGDVVRDGPLQWRCEAPHLFRWGPFWNSDTGNLSSMGALNGVVGGPGTMRAFNNLQTRNSLIVLDGFTHRGAIFRQASNSQMSGRQQNDVFSANVSRLTIRTSRSEASWRPAPGQPQVPRDGWGRFGSLTLPGWYNGGGKYADGKWQSDPLRTFISGQKLIRGGSAGYAGASPASDEPTGHPAWMAAEVGVVDGFDRSYARPFELRFTSMWMLR
jgi:type II secretory pathway pseudopilin PulG